MQQIDHERNEQILFAKAFNFRKYLLKHTQRGMKGKDLYCGIAVAASSKKKI